MINAYMNHARWIVECPECHWAIAVRRGQLQGSRFVCGVLPDGKVVVTGCGFTDRVRFPADIEEIEKVVRARPTSESNWLPGETVADLRIENAAHGLRSGIEVRDRLD